MSTVMVPSREAVQVWHYVSVTPERPHATMWTCIGKRVVNFVSSATADGNGIESGWHGSIEPCWPMSRFGDADRVGPMNALYGNCFHMTFRYKGPCAEDNWLMVERTWTYLDSNTYISRGYKLIDTITGASSITGTCGQSVALLVLSSCDGTRCTDVAETEEHFTFLEALRMSRDAPQAVQPPTSGTLPRLPVSLALAAAARGELISNVLPGL